jgi:hypothetical protein
LGLINFLVISAHQWFFGYGDGLFKEKCIFCNVAFFGCFWLLVFLNVFSGISFLKDCNWIKIQPNPIFMDNSSINKICYIQTDRV